MADQEYGIRILAFSHWAGSHITVDIKDSAGWLYIVKVRSEAFDTLFGILPEAEQVWKEAEVSRIEANRPNGPDTDIQELFAGGAQSELTVRFDMNGLYELKARQAKGFTFP